MTTRHIILRQDEDGYWNGECPSLKGCFSQGDTVDECISNMREAIQAYIESLTKHGEPIPPEENVVSMLVAV